MRIVIDALGGDHAPQQPILGALQAARELGCGLIFVGPEARIHSELAQHSTHGLDISVIDAPEVIGMDEHPALAVRRKQRSAHVVGLRLVRDGSAAAFVSAGHSGATMAGATLILGRIPGVERPALATVFPSVERPILLLDVGANTDCKPEYLLQFAHMGSEYAERLLGYHTPRVALLANGEEDTKGDRLVQESHALLRHSSLNFVGNAEPKDALVNGVCDVLVCDGFVGNLFLKQAEATVRLVAELALNATRRSLGLNLLPGVLPAGLLLASRSTRLGGLLGMVAAAPALVGSVLIPAVKRLRQVADYRSYGGAPLLGLKGVAIIAHGKSDAAAIASAVRQARDAVLCGAVTELSETMFTQQT